MNQLVPRRTEKDALASIDWDHFLDSKAALLRGPDESVSVVQLASWRWSTANIANAHNAFRLVASRESSECVCSEGIKKHE